jgi:hypothetical protein
VEDLGTQREIPTKKTPVKTKQEEKGEKDKQLVWFDKVPIYIDINWHEVFHSDIPLNFEDHIMKSKLDSITSKITQQMKQKDKQSQQEAATT